MLTRIKDPKGINIFPAAWVEASITEAKHSDNMCASVGTLVLMAGVQTATSYAALLFKILRPG